MLRTFIFLIALSLAPACSSLPEPKFKRYALPEEGVYLDEPPSDRKFKIVGPIRTRVDFSAMIQEKTEDQLCSNYYNKAVNDLLFKARKRMDADAIIQVRSVVFYLDGKTELHKDAQCSEDEGEGQILLQGQAIRWLTESESTQKEKVSDRPRKKI